MSYKPQGASLPARFKKTNDSKSNFKQYPQSRLAVVDEYKLDENDPQKSSLLATERATGRKLEIKISRDKAGVGSRMQTTSFNGNLIDERMAKNIQPGDSVALEGCITDKNDKATGVSHMSCNWIIQDNAPEKSFISFITASSYQDRARGFQAYTEGARNINPATDDGPEAISALGQKMDEAFEAYKAGEHPITFGAKFHAMIKVGEKDGVNEYQVIDRTFPFDWIRAEKDDQDNIISGDHPMNSQYLENYLEGYLDYVYGAQDQSVEGAEPGLVARGVVPKGTEIIVEVMPFRALTASGLSKHMETSNPRSPLSAMCNVMTKFGQLEDDKAYVGKNWARKAVVLFTTDQAPTKRDSEWKVRNLVTRVLPFGRQLDVDAAFPAFDGGRISIHPALAAQRDFQNDNQQPASNSDGVSSRAEPMSFTAVDMPEEDDEGGSYFANSVAAAAAPVVENTPSDSVVADPVPDMASDKSDENNAETKPAQEEAKAKPAARFQRRST